MESEKALCKNCNYENRISSELCERCSAPLSGLPPQPAFETLLSGRVHYQAMGEPKKPIVVIGVYIWIGPLAIAAIIAAGSYLIQSDYRSASIFAILSLLPIYLLVKTTLNYKKYKRLQQSTQED